MKEIEKKLSRLIPDRMYLTIRYRARLGVWPNLKNPTNYNEKVQWLKLYDRKTEYINMVDKYEAKKYIAKMVGEQYVIQTYGIWDNFDEIDFNSLPERFVLKCTHNSGDVILCSDKSKLDFDDTRERINRNLKENYFWHSREWPYKNVQPRIMAEEYLGDKTTGEVAITDYKFLCFDGEPKILFLTREMSSDPYADCYDMSFNKMDLRFPDPNSDFVFEKPVMFEEMKQISRKLSHGLAHLRVDFYLVNGKLYIGELTFYHCAGLAKITPEHWNQTLGDWITLPER